MCGDHVMLPRSLNFDYKLSSSGSARTFSHKYKDQKIVVKILWPKGLGLKEAKGVSPR